MVGLANSIRAKMLNKKARRESGGILSNLDIQAGNTIADIGSGGGYFTFAFAERVGKNGRVYAVDTNRNLLDYIARNTQASENIRPVMTDEGAVPSLEHKCDLIFLRNVFHHISNAVCYFEDLKSLLKPTGKVAIIERDPKTKGLYASQAGHCTPESKILKTMEKAGFKRWKTFAFWEWQSFNIFTVDETRGWN